eukprot:SM007666S21902  [mRNA]  locus=s7666:88:696:- [translate_table: standard]
MELLLNKVRLLEGEKESMILQHKQSVEELEVQNHQAEAKWRSSEATLSTVTEEKEELSQMCSRAAEDMAFRLADCDANLKELEEEVMKMRRGAEEHDRLKKNLLHSLEDSSKKQNELQDALHCVTAEKEEQAHQVQELQLQSRGLEAQVVQLKEEIVHLNTKSELDTTAINDIKKERDAALHTSSILEKHLQEVVLQLEVSQK